MSDAAERELGVLTAIAEEAGALARERRSTLTEGDVRFKSGTDLVTNTDLEIEELLQKRLGSAFPGARFVGEESAGHAAGEDGEVLIVDPLDGTANFVHGIPYYSVSVALVRDGHVHAGVVVAPELELVYSARRGSGAYCNGGMIGVSDREPLRSALVSTGFAALRYGAKPDNIGLFSYMAYQVRGVRRFGSAAIDLCYVADGKIDVFWEYGLHDWDIAAGALIVEEAGGSVSTVDGVRSYLGEGNILATNGRVHGEFLDHASRVAQH
jgi:myo-inositol-1(or 4)-monophosphatase